MDKYGCDYECRTVGEGIMKYNIPDNWCAEFDAYDCAEPIICIQVDQVRKFPAIMDLNLRIVENPDGEFAGCIVIRDQETIAFKIDCMRELTRAIAAKTI